MRTSRSAEKCVRCAFGGGRKFYILTPDIDNFVVFFTINLEICIETEIVNSFRNQSKPLSEYQRDIELLQQDFVLNIL